MYGINVDDDQTRALAFAHGESVTFPLLLDPEKAVSRSYQVDNLPMTVEPWLLPISSEINADIARRQADAMKAQMPKGHR